MVSAGLGGSYLRLIDSCITQLKAQGPSRTCNESKEEEEKVRGHLPRRPVRNLVLDPKSTQMTSVLARGGLVYEVHRLLYHSAQGSRTF